MRTDKKPLFWSVIFVAYHFVTHLFLSVHLFFEYKGSLSILLSIDVIVLLTIQFGFLALFHRMKRNSQIVNSFTYTFSSLVTAIILFLWFDVYHEFYVSYGVAYLLSGLVFSLFHFAVQFFQQLSTSSYLEIHQKQQESDSTSNQTFTLLDTKGKTRLDIAYEYIICFEANDNYVTIYFEDSMGKFNKRLERISMKRIEESLISSSKDFLRIHKSYLINTDYIENISGKAQAYKVRLKHFTIDLPVSRKVDIAHYNR